MIKIGDFARLGQVSVAALRHYDVVGLLKPALVDRATGYRYYSGDQLSTLNRIIALKDLGFSLEQIEQVLSGLTADQLRGMLMFKQAEVERQVSAEQDRLARIAARLRQIELEDAPLNQDVALKTTPSMLVATLRLCIPTDDQACHYLSSANTELFNYVRKGGARDIGPHFAVWHQPSDALTNLIVDVALPIDRPLADSNRVKVTETPPAQVATIVHHGEIINLNQEHATLQKWIENTSHQMAGAYREIYINRSAPNVSEFATEIQYPVEKIVS